MSSNLKTLVSYTSLSAALLLCACTEADPNNPGPVGQGSNTNVTATGGMGDSGGLDETGGDTGGDSLDDTSSADDTGGDSGGDICDPSIFRQYCTGKAYFVYCNPAPPDDNTDCYTRPFGDPKPGRWCALPPGETATGEAQGIEVAICATDGAETAEINMACSEVIEGMTAKELGVPEELEIIDGEGLWPGSFVYVPWGQNDDFGNVASGGCSTNALGAAVMATDSNGDNVPCTTDECAGLETSCGHELDGLRSSTKGNAVYTKLPLETLNELREESTSLQYCEGQHGGYNPFYHAFAIANRTHLYYKLGLRNWDIPLTIRGGGNVYPVNDAVYFFTAFADLRDNVFPPGSHVDLEVDVYRDSQIVTIHIKTN